MKNADQINSTPEETKNVITASIAGASLGLLYAYGFEISLVIGLVAGALFGAAIGFRISRKPPKMRYPMALFRRILIAATILLLTSFGYSYLLDQEISQSQKLWAAVLPLLGWASLVVSIGMAIASMDELQRRIQTEAIAISFAGTAIFVGGYALFQFAGLSEVNVGLVLLVMSFTWLFGKLWTLWRYR
ncbi:MAG: hypothetical protein WBB69_09270 [Anaerolineales bacterium]